LLEDGVLLVFVEDEGVPDLVIDREVRVVRSDIDGRSSRFQFGRGRSSQADTWSTSEDQETEKVRENRSFHEIVNGSNCETI
jgi:hypothetical protein